jgi:hypothetical protein
MELELIVSIAIFPTWWTNLIQNFQLIQTRVQVLNFQKNGKNNSITFFTIVISVELWSKQDIFFEEKKLKQISSSTYATSYLFIFKSI